MTPSNNPKSALTDSGAKAPRDAMWMVPFEKLVVKPGENPRDQLDPHWHELVRTIADDMKEVGWRKSKPAEVLVNEAGEIILTDAGTRYAAATLARSEGAANLDMIPCVALDKSTTAEQINVGYVANNNSSRLTPLGFSIVAHRLVRVFGNTGAEAAKKLGVSPKYIDDMLILFDAPEAIKAMVRNGQVSGTLAIETIKEHGNEEALRILQEALTDAQSKGKTKARAKNVPKEKQPEDRMLSAQHKHAPTMYQLMMLLIVKDIAPEKEQEIKDRMEQVLFAIETDAEGSTGSAE